ncbi:MAG: UDP-N-acetylmuramoyl-tripeptide--D-alanyl-D-alanine ligase [uncultured Nocardioides sp.]|uniref:UDP-N-acetylmuramoyl-tripeptide--D-alanyl-D-alanine ligase n=1 Tax=uncultured Nocardioides sp. TaxID=198441 RepID=A0A6J4NHX1_9ACTN|nr:MAG: UDP-N-acetylmuramoyl-tripeptide--D-alanyl-D-alanine ligase [uncultured Nocardioides sp.]
MIEMTLAEIATAVGGTLHGDAVVTGPAFVDTRTPHVGGLFVAVAGERVDGHDFAGTALAAGAAAVLGTRPTEAPTVVVDDTVRALGRLSRHVLDRLDTTTVHALTGSQGKTGVKDYLAAVLAQDGPTIATEGNFNNEIGVPLTVLRATPGTGHLVVEMGARGIGHIAYLCELAPPDVAAVLNVGTAHIGEFGSQEAIARGKGEIVEALRPEGTAVLNADDPLVAAMAGRTRARVLRFGRGGEVSAEDVTHDELGRPTFRLVHGGRSAEVRLRQLGSHQVANALAAAGMALAVGLPLDDVARALGDAVPASRWRMELREQGDGLVVVNDAYNANPESVEAALDTLNVISRRSGRRTVAVLGEMLELGEGSVAGHRRVGHFAAASRLDVLVTVGDAAADIADAARGHRTWRGEAVPTASRAEALEWLRHNVSAGDVVLVKASRGAALETVAEGLLAESVPDRLRPQPAHQPPHPRHEGTSTR